MLSQAGIPILIIMAMVAANALYVAAEFATVGSRRSRVQELAERGDRSASRLLVILRDPMLLDRYVAACQIGITVSSLVAGMFGHAQLTPLLVPVLGNLGGQVAAILIVLVSITAVQVVLGELLPKTVALRYPERLAMATLLPMQVSLWLFRPLIAVFNGSAFALMRASGLHVEQTHAHVHSPDELEALYNESAAGGLIDAAERDMLAGALNVDQRRVREIMTPRTRLVTVKAHETLTAALTRLAATPYSRFPVVEGDVDAVVGTVHIRALFAAAEKDPQQLVSAVMRPPLIVAEVMKLPDLWQVLRNGGRHSAIVVNEYGSVAGMVTREDALEEIFGEVQDEFDDEQEPIIIASENVWVRGDVLVETLNQRFEVELPTDEVDTVSGLVWHLLGRLPTVGDEVEVSLEAAGHPLRVRVEAMERSAVRLVSFALADVRQGAST
jgi:CBS domain containing-hemolysin-like protein